MSLKTWTVCALNTNKKITPFFLTLQNTTDHTTCHTDSSGKNRPPSTCHWEREQFVHCNTNKKIISFSSRPFRARLSTSVRLFHFRWEFHFHWEVYNLLLHEDVPLVEFMYLAFTRMPGDSYRRRFRSLLFYLCDVFGALINSLVCWFCIVYSQK